MPAPSLSGSNRNTVSAAAQPSLSGRKTGYAHHAGQQGNGRDLESINILTEEKERKLCTNVKIVII